MSAPIKAIETSYAGCRFRSRLEARWAVFFDHLGVPWRYEPEGYDLGDGTLYLPDFLIYPDQPHGFWFEVKGVMPDRDELDKAERLALGTERTTYVYFRQPEQPAPPMTHITTMDQYTGDEGYVWVDEWGWTEYPVGPPKWQLGLSPTAWRFNRKPLLNQANRRSNFWWWTDCPHCGLVIPKLCGQVGWCPSFGDNVPPEAEPLYPRFAHATPRLADAYRAARSARFEHGERGR